MKRNNILTSHPHVPDAGPPPLGQGVQFLERLGRALHRYGLPSHRLEEALDAVAQRLGYHAQFFATPTAVFATVSQGGDERTVLIRVDPGETQLEKLSLLDELLSDVVSGKVGVAEASARVDAIVWARPRYGRRLVILAFALASGTAALFFGGGWREMAVCAVIGLATGLLGWLAASAPRRFRVFEPAAAFVAALLASAAGAWVSPLSMYVTTCAGLIILLPGLSLTVAIHELVTRNLAAGTVRLTYALFTFLQIGFGVAAGLKVGSWSLAEALHLLTDGEPRTLLEDPEARPILINRLASMVMATGEERQALLEAPGYEGRLKLLLRQLKVGLSLADSLARHPRPDDPALN